MPTKLESSLAPNLHYFTCTKKINNRYGLLSFTAISNPIGGRQNPMHRLAKKSRNLELPAEVAILFTSHVKGSCRVFLLDVKTSNNLTRREEKRNGMKLKKWNVAGYCISSPSSRLSTHLWLKIPLGWSLTPF